MIAFPHTNLYNVSTFIYFVLGKVCILFRLDHTRLTHFFPPRLVVDNLKKDKSSVKTYSFLLRSNVFQLPLSHVMLRSERHLVADIKFW